MEFDENALKQYDMTDKKGDNPFSDIACEISLTTCALDSEIFSDFHPSLSDLECYNHENQKNMATSSSTKAYIQTNQWMKSNEFTYFDYGAEENMEKYGQKTPPKYPIEKISEIPIAFFFGIYDNLGSLSNNQWLLDIISKNIVYIGMYKYMHASFAYSKNMEYLEELVQLLDKY